jgi:hypothetical protein
MCKLLISLLLIGCVPKYDCTTACQHLRDIDCPAGSDKSACEETCNRLKDDPWYELDVECLCKIQTCDQEVECGR